MHKTEAFQPFRALQSAWEILMKAPLPMWVGGLILVVIEQFSGAGWNFNFGDGRDFERHFWLFIPVLGLGLVLTIVVMAVTSWLKVGYYGGVEAVMREGDFEFERIFKTQGRWMNVFLVHVFQLILVVVAVLPFFLCSVLAMAIGHGVGLRGGEMAALVGLVCLFYVPVFIYFLLGFTLMPYAAALDELGPKASLARSWSLADGLRVQLFLMGLLHLALTILGLCVLCVGSLAGMILGHVMWTEAYVQATRDDLGDWWINTRHEAPRDGPVAPELGADFDTPQEVEAQAKRPVPPPPREPELERPPSTGSDEGTTDTAFDPSAWRKGSDIPPIEDDPA